MTSSILRAGMFSNRDLLEGDDESRRAARKSRTRQARILAARAHQQWREYQPDELTPRKHGPWQWYQTPEGDLLAVVRYPVFNDYMREDLQVACSTWNEGASTAFVVNADGEVVVFEPAPIRTAFQLDMHQTIQRNRESTTEMNERARELDLRQFRRMQPTRLLSLADLERRPMPTVQAAAAKILDHAGTLNVRRGCLEIGLPEQLSDNQNEHDDLFADLLDSATVLLAAGSIVVGALESSSKKPLVERLPDVQVLASGGVA